MSGGDLRAYFVLCRARARARSRLGPGKQRSLRGRPALRIIHALARAENVVPPV
jgi:hypothetical protein